MKKKKTVIIGIAAVLVLGAAASTCGGGSDSTATTEVATEAETTSPETTTAAETTTVAETTVEETEPVTTTEAPTETAAPETTAAETAAWDKKQAEKEMYIQFYKRVTGDKSGGVRCLTYYTGTPIEDIVVPMYKTYTDDACKVMWMVNLGTKTTFRVIPSGDMIIVSAFEHVKGEEASVDTLGSGMPMGDDEYFSLETGKKIDF